MEEILLLGIYTVLHIRTIASHVHDNHCPDSMILKVWVPQGPSQNSVKAIFIMILRHYYLFTNDAKTMVNQADDAH